MHVTWVVPLGKRWPEAGEQLGHKPPPVGLDQPVADRVDGMVKPTCFQHSERSGSDRPICDYRLLAHFGQIEENAGMAWRSRAKNCCPEAGK